MNFQFPWGGSFWLKKETGIVKNIDKEVHNDISTSHSTVSGTNQIRTNVESSTRYVSSFWLEFGDGKEKNYDFTTGHKITPMLHGHKVSVIYGAKSGNDDGTYIYVQNETTGNGTAVGGARDFGLTTSLTKLFILPGFIVWIFLFALFQTVLFKVMNGPHPQSGGISDFFGSFWIAFIVSAIYGFSRMYTLQKRLKKFSVMVKKYAENENDR
jgi:hypothetical protein